MPKDYYRNYYRQYLSSFTLDMEDVDALALINVIQNIEGIPLSVDQIAYVHFMIGGLKDPALDLWGDQDCVYLHVGADADAHKYNAKDPRDLDAAYRIEWYGGGLHTATGYKPNGTNGYGDTNYIPNVRPIDDFQFSSYIRTNLTGTAILDIGNLFGPTSSYIAPDFSFNNYRACNGPQTGPVARGYNTAAFWTALRSVGTHSKQFRNKTLTDTDAASNVGFTAATSSFFIGAVNNIFNPSFQYYSPREHAFDMIGKSFSDIKQGLLYDLVQAGQTMLSRQV